MSKRELLNKAIYFTGLSVAIRHYKQYFKNELPILAYHRISDYEPNSLNNDIELISATPKIFEEQLRYIDKHYTPITFSELEHYTQIRKKVPTKKPQIIITFDDGFYDNYEYAYPLLKKYNMPATFFLVTSAIDNQMPLWFDYIAYMIMTYEHETLILNKKKYTLSYNRAEKRKFIEKLLLDLRPINNTSRLQIIDELEQQTGCLNKYLKYVRYLGWNEIKEMSCSGMEFGSHSLTHPILSSINEKELYNEVKLSKEAIEENLNKPCDIFSYPVGGYEEYNKCAIKALYNCNYKYACTYEPGINKLPIYDRFQLKRIHIERYTSFPTFKNVITSSIFTYK